MARVQPLISLASQQQLLERLLHLVQLSSQIIFISGAEGAGKSSLAQLLVDNAAAGGGKPCLLTCQSQQQAQVQRRILLSQLVDEPLFDAADPLSDSAMRMLGESPAKRLLVFDDAQHLHPQLLAELTAWMVANQQRPAPHQLNILLLAEPDWSASHLPLVRDQLAAGQVIELEVAELHEADIQQLVGWRYRQAGIDTPFPNVEAVERCLDDDQAVTPALVLAATEHCLDLEEAPSPLPASVNHRYRRMGWLVLLLVVIGLLLSWGYEPIVARWQRLSGELAQLESPEVEAPAALPEAIPAEPLTDAASPEPLAGSWPDEVAEVQLPELLSGAEMTLESPQSGRERVVLPDEVLRMLIANQQRKKQQQAEAKPAQERSEEKEPAAAPRADVPPLASAADMADAAGGETASEPPGTADDGAVPTDSAAVRQADGVNVPFEEWSLTPVALLRQKPANHYTLQLAGLSERSHLHRFLRQYQLQDSAWTYQTERGGVPWYVVIYGDYPDLNSASQAIQLLSDDLQAQSPWIKSFKQVQRELH